MKMNTLKKHTGPTYYLPRDCKLLIIDSQKCTLERNQCGLIPSSGRKAPKKVINRENVLKKHRNLQSARHSKRRIADLTIFPSEEAENKAEDIDQQNKTLNFFSGDKNNDKLQPNYHKLLENSARIVSKKRSRYFKLKSLGISDNTSQTMDTKVHKREDSSSSKLGRLTKREQRRLFNYRFIKGSTDPIPHSSQLNSLKKTVKDIYDRSERLIYTSDCGKSKFQ
ncbi:unnamed protein product [Moneuplotes crassus]|uniref:Uncharacterized protein n=1 Tax=Euplotes crassus TaxID=5936 RepID=A0AAD1UK28_EUPCR|nr:unnamed protein product [Moneuplotes crassus]